MEEDPQPNPDTKNSGTTSAPTLVDIINVVADRAEPFVKILEAFAERSLKLQEAAAKQNAKMAWIVVVVVSFVVLVAGFLTYAGKIDGSTFGFLLGLIVGYVLTFMRDSIKPAKSE